jgi:UDP-N-acetylglucosamine acyltransferase
MNISPLASVHPSAIIGQNVVVEPFAVVYANVKLGDNVWIGPHAVVMDYVKIGTGSKVFPSAVVGGIPQDLKFEGEVSWVEVGENTTIREFVSINRGTKALGTTKIGDNCLVMAYTHVAHDCQIGNDVILVNNVQIAGHVEIADWAVVGGSSSIHQFVKIGSHAMIAGGSLVRKDVPPFITAAREPLGFTGINTLGLKRRGFSNEEIDEIHEIYRLIYQSELNHSEVLKSLKKINQTVNSQLIIEFLDQSTRGIISGKKRIIKD